MHKHNRINILKAPKNKRIAVVIIQTMRPSLSSQLNKNLSLDL